LLPLPALVIFGSLGYCFQLATGGEHSSIDPRNFGQVFTSGPIQYFLAPLTLLAAPIGAASLGSFLSTVWIPLGVFAALAVLVVKMDVAFEEQATVLAGKISKIKAGGIAAAQKDSKLVVKEGTKPLFALAP